MMRALKHPIEIVIGVGPSNARSWATCAATSLAEVDEELAQVRQERRDIDAWEKELHILRTRIESELGICGVRGAHLELIEGGLSRTDSERKR